MSMELYLTDCVPPKPLKKYCLIPDLDSFHSMNQDTSLKPYVSLNATHRYSHRLLYSFSNP